MDNYVLMPGAELRGTVKIPSSKSAAHRAAICAMLAGGNSFITGVTMTQDMAATNNAARALGADVHYREGALEVEGLAKPSASAEIDCGESGSTLRFMVPVAAALGVRAAFTGHGKLPQRPIRPLTDVLSLHGVTCTRERNEILTLAGQLQSGVFSLPGDISSQYVTGLLLALPLLDGNSEIRLTTPLQSRGYVDMTVQTMARFGVRVEETATGWTVPGNQRYQPQRTAVEGDYSAAAFWLCGGAISPQSSITLTNLSPQSLQGDKAVLEVLERFGARVRHGPRQSVRVEHQPLMSVDIDAGDIPDLVPALAVVAACAQGKTTIYNAARLRIKESDRLDSVTQGLRNLGGRMEEYPDKLEIYGRPSLKGGRVDACNDHRIAMAMAIASLACEGPVTIVGAECVAKSYPGFWRDFLELGGSIDGI